MARLGQNLRGRERRRSQPAARARAIRTAAQRTAQDGSEKIAQRSFLLTSGSGDEKMFSSN